jgi:WD40 repeat protein
MKILEILKRRVVSKILNNSMELLISKDCQQGALRAVRYNVDGDYILTCGSNKTVKLWNAKTLVIIVTIFESECK